MIDLYAATLGMSHVSCSTISSIYSDTIENCISSTVIGHRQVSCTAIECDARIIIYENEMINKNR